MKNRPRRPAWWGQPPAPDTAPPRLQIPEEARHLADFQQAPIDRGRYPRSARKPNLSQLEGTYEE